MFVHRAVHKDSGDVVAIKTAKQGPNSHAGTKALLKEKEALQILQHKNILTLVEVMELKDFKGNLMHLSLALECCATDLDDLLSSDQCLTHGEIKSTAKQLFLALQYLRCSRVIHCDIQPRNILLTSEGVVKLCDFGFARINRFQKPDCGPQGFTPGYCPPEVFLGARKLNTKADMWSVGCVLPELYTKRLLFPMNDLEEIIKICGSVTTDNWKGLEKMPYYLPGGLRENIPRVLMYKLSMNVRDKHMLRLINSILQWDPKRRMSAATALKSEYFRSAPPPKSLKRRVAMLLEEMNNLKRKRSAGSSCIIPPLKMMKVDHHNYMIVGPKQEN